MRKRNRLRPHVQKISEHSRYLSPAELLYCRLDLAHDMVHLALNEGDTPTLPPPMQATLEGLLGVLAQTMREVQELP